MSKGHSIKLKTAKVKIPIKIDVFWDNLTECFVIYNKKYDLSAYGQTKKEAKKMLIFTILEILKDTKPKKKKNDKSRKSSS